MKKIPSFTGVGLGKVPTGPSRLYGLAEDGTSRTRVPTRMRLVVR